MIFISRLISIVSTFMSERLYFVINRDLIRKRVKIVITFLHLRKLIIIFNESRPYRIAISSKNLVKITLNLIRYIAASSKDTRYSL